MKRDSFKTLPSEITFNILSRLPVRSIASSKCVCKPWLHLLSTDYFVNLHLSKPVPSLAFSRVESATSVYQVFEFGDGVERHDFRSNQATKFNFPHKATITSAANGLLLLQPVGSRVDDDVYIVNPVTREYVVVAAPNEELLSKKRPRFREHGFGASRSRRHKVVRINDKSECYVYTLETGLWRRVAVEPAHASLCFLDICCSAFVGGLLYWTVWFIASPALVACFDLETECFSSFEAPASRGELSVLKDCLCFCECEVKSDEIVLWLMKEKSWSKEYVMKKPVCDERCYRPCPFNVFRNGDLLMLSCDKEFLLCYYSKETKALQEMAGFVGLEESIFSMRKEAFQIEESAVKSVTENARAQARLLAAKGARRAVSMSRPFIRISAISPNEHGDVSGRKEIEATYPPIDEIEEFRDSFEGVDLKTGDRI